MEDAWGGEWNGGVSGACGRQTGLCGCSGGYCAALVGGDGGAAAGMDKLGGRRCQRNLSTGSGGGIVAPSRWGTYWGNSCARLDVNTHTLQCGSVTVGGSRFRFTASRRRRAWGVPHQPSAVVTAVAKVATVAPRHGGGDCPVFVGGRCAGCEPPPVRTVHVVQARVLAAGGIPVRCYPCAGALGFPLPFR